MGLLSPLLLAPSLPLFRRIRPHPRHFIRRSVSASLRAHARARVGDGGGLVKVEAETLERRKNNGAAALPSSCHFHRARHKEGGGFVCRLWFHHPIIQYPLPARTRMFTCFVVGRRCLHAFDCYGAHATSLLSLSPLGVEERAHAAHEPSSFFHLHNWP